MTHPSLLRPPRSKMIIRLGLILRAGRSRRDRGTWALDLLLVCSPATFVVGSNASKCSNKETAALKLFGTHPKAQRRGAGSLLMAWVTELADREGLPCWVTASPVVVPLYKKFGFQIMEEIVVQLPAGSGEGTYTHTCMLREPKTG